MNESEGGGGGGVEGQKYHGEGLNEVDVLWKDTKAILGYQTQACTAANHHA